MQMRFTLLFKQQFPVQIHAHFHERPYHKESIVMRGSARASQMLNTYEVGRDVISIRCRFTLFFSPSNTVSMPTITRSRTERHFVHVRVLVIVADSAAVRTAKWVSHSGVVARKGRGGFKETEIGRLLRALLAQLLPIITPSVRSPFA